MSYCDHHIIFKNHQYVACVFLNAVNIGHYISVAVIFCSIGVSNQQSATGNLVDFLL